MHVSIIEQHYHIKIRYREQYDHLYQNESFSLILGGVTSM